MDATATLQSNIVSLLYAFVLRSASSTFLLPPFPYLLPPTSILLPPPRPVLKDCNDEKKPTFWTDMCSQIPTNATDYLNLQRNPERWTGYVVGWWIQRCDQDRLEHVTRSC